MWTPVLRNYFWPTGIQSQHKTSQGFHLIFISCGLTMDTFSFIWFTCVTDSCSLIPKKALNFSTYSLSPYRSEKHLALGAASPLPQIPGSHRTQLWVSTMECAKTLYIAVTSETPEKFNLRQSKEQRTRDRQLTNNFLSAWLVPCIPDIHYRAEKEKLADLNFFFTSVNSSS